MTLTRSPGFFGLVYQSVTITPPALSVCSSGMKLSDSLFQEKSKAYVNIGAIRNDHLNTQWAKDVIAAYRSAEFKAYALKRFPGYNYPPGWKP